MKPTPDEERGPFDLELVRAALSGSEAAREVLVDRMRCIPRMLRFMNSRCGDVLGPHDLGDLAQDVFQLVWSKLPEFSGAAALETWVYKFCNLTFLGRTRQVKRRREREIADAQEPPAATPRRLATEDAERVMDALDLLAEADRRLVERKLFDGETFADLANELGQSANTLKTRYYRALDRIAVQLKRLFGDGHEAA